MKNIPFLSFSPTNRLIKEEVLESFEAFFDSGWYINGNQLTEFESQYSKYNGVNHTVGVSNGLDALILALHVLGVKEGDEVIVPSNTYIASLLAVSFVGARPVLVEPDINTYNINPDNIQKAITNRTKAIMPVHLYGQACEMEAIAAIAQKYNLYIVEDNAQSQGASFNKRMTGAWGEINATSFYPGKNLGALGDAGAITTNSDELAEKVRILRNYGSHKKYYNEVLGYNMRLDECQAGFLSVKLKYLEKWTKERQQIAEWYNEGLKGQSLVTLPKVADGATHVYHLYVIRSFKRNELQQYLLEHGIGTLIHYPVPPHLQKAYDFMKYTVGDFPIAEEIADTCLSLPLWPGMDKEMVNHVCNKINAFFDGN